MSVFKSQQGVTLIDMSIIILVLGLLSTTLIQEYVKYYKEKSYRETDAKLQIILRDAIENYYIENGHYPCPANPSLTQGDEYYGKEIINCAVTAPSAHSFVKGDIPFVDLGISSKDALDGWSNKFVYVVSKNLTQPIIAEGTLNILGIDEMGTTIAWSNTAHVFIYSSGSNGVGGISSEGNLIESCPTGSNKTRESENCDDDNIFFHHSLATRSDWNDVNYYDDLSNYIDLEPSKIWQYSRDDKDDVISQGLNIGIANNNPEYSLDVIGNVKIENDSSGANGNAGTQQLCDSNGGNCFQPDIIAGSGINCGGQALNGIAYGSAKCASLQLSSTAPAIFCPANQFVTGFDSSGSAICMTLP